MTCSFGGGSASAVATRLPVDRAAVVGVHQGQAEQLVALVDVGDARHGQLEQELAERGAVAGLRDLALEGLEVAQELAVGEQGPREALDRRLVLDVGRDPRGVLLGLAHRLLEVGLEALGRDRPDAQQRLEDEVLLDGGRGAAGGQRAAGRRATCARGPRTRRPSPPARRSAPGRRRSAWCRASGSRAGCAGSAPRAPGWRRGTLRRHTRSGPGRHPRHSKPAAARSGRRPCPRRPWPSPAASSAGSA